MKKLIGLTLMCLLVHAISFAGNYTWTGTINSSWDSTGNWNSSVVPTSSDTITINSTSNSLVLDGNRTVRRIVINSDTLDLGGDTLTITVSAGMNGGTINNGVFNAQSSELLNFSGTTFNAVVIAKGRIKLNGCVFNTTASFEHNNSTDGTGSGGNTFNGVTTLKNSGTTAFRLAGANPDIFNNDVTIINVSSAGNLQLSYGATTYFNGNIEVSASTSTISFSGSGDGSSILDTGKTITIGSAGVAGTLLLRNFTQLSNTAQSLSLSGTLNLINSTFIGAFTCSASGVLLSTCNFYGTSNFTKTGTTSNYSAGGNHFFESATINNNAPNSAILRFAATSGDIYHNDVALNTNTGFIQLAYSDTNEFKGDISINSSKVTFNNGNGIVQCTGGNAQEFGGSAAFVVGKLWMNKSTNFLTLQKAVTIDSLLTLTSGIVYTDSTNLLTLKAGGVTTGASDSSYIDGPMKKIGNTAFEFPVGEDDYYGPIRITAPTQLTDAFIAQYFAIGNQLGDSMVSSIDYLSPCNYWTLNRNVGSSTIKVALSWSEEFCSILDSNDLRVANWDGNKWIDLGIGVFEGTINHGSIQSDSVVLNYTFFTHGYRSTDIPISLLSNDTMIYADSVLQLTYVSNNGTTTWFPPSMVSILTSSTIEISTNANRYFYLTTTDYKSRISTDSILITVNNSLKATPSFPLIAPGVEWRSSEWFEQYPDFPLIFGSNANQPITQINSGEEWWYAHDNSYNGLGEIDGYICGGYVTYLNTGYDESSTGGCQAFNLSPLTCFDCDELESANNVKGKDYAVVSLKATNGRDRLWDRVLVLGSILNIRSTADGGYIAVGLSHSSRTMEGDPLFYNPRENQSQFDEFTCAQVEWINNACTFGNNDRRFSYVVKLDHAGDIEWQYLYGTQNYNDIVNATFGSSISSQAWDITETSFGYVFVGESNGISDGGCINYTGINKKTCAAWYINHQGELIIDNGQAQFGFFANYSLDFGKLGAVASYIDQGLEKIVFSGFQNYSSDLSIPPTPCTHKRSFAFQVLGQDLFPDNSSQYEWVLDDANINASLCGQNNVVWDVAIQPNIAPNQPVQIFLPVLYDCGITGGGRNTSCAGSRIYRIDGTSGTVISHVDFGHIETYDLKIGITPTSDGGYGMVSSRIRGTPLTSVPANIGLCNAVNSSTIVSWTADAYIGRADANDNILWAVTVDRTENPMPTAYPDDVKHMECLYTITQSDDGGFVVAGNNSINFDDFYMIKLFPECDVLNTTYTNYNDVRMTDFVQEISTNETWSSDRTLLGSIHIRSGAKLTINNGAIIRFADSKRVARSNGTNIISNLIVEPNGQLEIGGGATLDVVNTCNSSMWDGIQVWGNPGLDQAFVNQGYLLSSNCSINNARIGIRAGGANYDLYANNYDDYQRGGGLIRTLSGTVFENCRKGAYFSPYPLPLGIGSSWNKSLIHGTSFICNDVMRDPLYIDANNVRVGVNEHLSIYGTSGISVYDCLFDNTATLLTRLDQHGIGISTALASLRINDNVFSNLNIGVHSQFSTFSNAISISKSDFNGNRQGVLLEGGFGSSIRNNDFSIPVDQIGSKLPFGVMTVGAEGFSIDHNNFIGDEEGLNFGVVVRQSGTNSTGADVRLNSFLDTHVGTQTEANNDNLRISCNDYTGHRYAWFIAPGSPGTLGDQGTGCGLGDIEAGNEFNDDDPETEEHILTTTPFTYWAWGDPVQTDPTYYDIDDVSTNMQSGLVQNCNGSGPDPSCAEEEPCDDPNCNEAYIERLAEIDYKYEWNRLFNEINRYFMQNDSNGTDDSYVAFLESVSDSSMGIAKLLSNLYLVRGNFSKADSMLDVIELLTDDTCITTFDRYLISLMEDSSSIFDISYEEFQNYQSCIESSESTSLHYEIIEDILDFVKHPREPEVATSLRIIPSSNQDSKINSTKFSVLNNPGMGNFVLNWKVSDNSDDFYMVRVYEVLGKSVLLKRVKITDGNLPLHLDEFKSGVYLIRIVNEKSNTFEGALKIVKQ